MYPMLSENGSSPDTLSAPDVRCLVIASCELVRWVASNRGRPPVGGELRGSSSSWDVRYRPQQNAAWWSPALLARVCEGKKTRRPSAGVASALGRGELERPAEVVHSTEVSK